MEVHRKDVQPIAAPTKTYDRKETFVLYHTDRQVKCCRTVPYSERIDPSYWFTLLVTIDLGAELRGGNRTVQVHLANKRDADADADADINTEDGDTVTAWIRPSKS